MKKLVVGLVLVFVSCSSYALSEEEQGNKDCMELASRIVAGNPKKKPSNIIDVTQIFTWRASCIDEVPVKMKKALGNVKTLCQANANTPSGDKKGIFYWEKANGQRSSIGFEWCETEFEL